MKLFCNYSLRTAFIISLCMLPALQMQAQRSLNDEIACYFAKTLQSQKCDFTKSKKIGTSHISETQDMVWQIWCDANKQCNEQQLPALAPLSKAPDVHYQWQLPDSLEPSAVMPFFYGSKGDKPEGGYPLNIYLHGSGPKANEWFTTLKWCQIFKDSPSAYFVPQIPNEGNWYRWWQKSKVWAWNKLIRKALCSKEINPRKLFFLGVSEGGYGSQRLASFYADYLAGAGPMAGGEPLRNAPAENCSQIAFSLLTGENDYMFFRNILTGAAKAAFDSLSTRYPGEYVHRIQLVPKSGHGFNYNLVFPWLSEHERNAQPSHWIWEDFEMDGIHRDGFYNMQILSSPAVGKGNRVRYEMRVVDNHVYLNIEEVTYKTLKKTKDFGIEMAFERTYKPIQSGSYRIYLSGQLVDLSKTVVVEVNGKRVASVKAKPNMEHLVNSCAFYGDPLRLFPSAVDIDLTK